MRSLLIARRASRLVPMPALAQAKKEQVDPIKVVKLDRKDPVVYEKDIEPIFYKKCITCH